MKTALKIAAGAFALSGLAGVAHGQATASANGTGSVTLVQPIALSSPTGLQFGKLVQPAAAASVTITPAGAVTRTGVGTLGSQTTSAALFNVTGDGGAIFTITGPAGNTFNMTASSSGTLLVTTSLSASSGTLSGTTGSGGATSFTVGGIMSIASAQTTGVYSGSFTVTVNYN